MTEEEALAEARRRWGPNALVMFLEEPSVHPSERYVVGYRTAAYFEIRGGGCTWEDAFYWASRNTMPDRE